MRKRVKKYLTILIHKFYSWNGTLENVCACAHAHYLLSNTKLFGFPCKLFIVSYLAGQMELG